MHKKRSKVKEFIFVLAVALFSPLLIGFIMIYLVWWFIYRAWLIFLVRLKWYPQGKYMLFVYSDSPNWKQHIEINILPRIYARALVINWSDRSKWDWKKKALELKVFHHWTGLKRSFFKGRKIWDGSEFNPVAITFIPWWRPRVFRFWRAFKDLKHGNEKSLKELEAWLFKILESKI